MQESWPSGGGLSPPPGQEGQAKCGGAKGQSLSHLPRWWLTWLLYFDLHGVLCSFIIVRVFSSIIISVIAGAWSWYMMGVHRCTYTASLMAGMTIDPLAFARPGS